MTIQSLNIKLLEVPSRLYSSWQATRHYPSRRTNTMPFSLWFHCSPSSFCTTIHLLPFLHLKLSCKTTSFGFSRPLWPFSFSLINIPDLPFSLCSFCFLFYPIKVNVPVLQLILLVQYNFKLGKFEECWNDFGY